MKKLNTKFLVSIFIIFFSLLYAIPALFQSFNILPSFIEKKSVRLGLDLQGGSQLLLQIETDQALEEKLQNLSEDIRIKLEEKNISSTSISLDKKTVKLIMEKDEDIDKAITIVKDFDSVDFRKENLVIQLYFTDKYINQFYSSLVLQSLEIIRKRKVACTKITISKF